MDIELTIENTKPDHYQPASETPFEWRFACGPMVARHCMLTGYMFIHGRYFCTRTTPPGSFRTVTINPVAGSEGVQGVRSNFPPRSLFKYPMKMK